MSMLPMGKPTRSLEPLTGVPTRDNPDFTRSPPDFRMRPLKTPSERTGEKIAAELTEIQRARKRTMSVMDKLDLIDQKHAEFEAGLDKDAQELLESYDALGKKKDAVFDRRKSVVAVRMKKFEDMDAAIDRLSNSGNSPSSSGSSTGA